MGGLVVAAWVFTALLLLVVACVAAGRGTLPLNHLFGVRIPALMRSDAAWRAGHAAGVVPGVYALVIAFGCSTVGLFTPVAYWGSIAAFVGGVAWVAVTASRAVSEA